ncbi:ABCAA protein, partial [Alcedo cyanopectus]|nr:ABCAA protein [Ceyx cyanopectus]
QRNMSIFQQTKILLWKNLLIKWRMKMQSFQEWLLSLLFLPLIFLVCAFISDYRYPEVPYSYLGKLDDPAYNATGVTVAFTPNTVATRQIMNKVALNSIMKGINLQALKNESTLEEAWSSDRASIGVVFKDNFSYQLRFSVSNVILPYDNFGYTDVCYDYTSEYCDSPQYWYRGFMSLQSSIDAAIIEMVTNHSVWEEMNSIAGVRMKSRSVSSSITLEKSYFMITVVMIFSPFMYFLSINVVKEKKKLKVLMKAMGLKDTAFWLSWSLLYAVYMMVFSCMLTALLVWDVFYFSSFPAVLLLFFLYGLACIHLVFMLCSLLRTSKLVGFMGFLITSVFGCLSLAVLVESLPRPLQWFLSLFCPFTFNVGISKVFHLEKYGIGLSFSNLMDESYFLFSTYIMLVFDSILYMLLAVYFDKVLPGKYGTLEPPFFFLKPSYWVRSKRDSSMEIPRTTVNPEELLGDDVEPVPPEFLGKEAIRINNIKKAYKKAKNAEALRGLSLNIYEGQITALLGHNGAGKTTLLNVLSGFTWPSEGSATIYNCKLSETGDREEISKMIGICPQFNIQFEILTVKENLRTFAEIKGIKSSEAEREVQNILEQLDITSIQDSQVEKLSGGQRRKLSIGIALLGNPQVLFLDEPTAGLDPLSRHQVWSLLKEHRAGRVILFSTQFMDEADIIADRKAFILHGRLQCVGSSLFLKKKWGIGYDLRIHVSESCDLENMTSLVKQYIPNVMFSGHSQYELRYKLPLEHVNRFPDLFRSLDSCSDQGILNYGVTMTTLEDVFLRLQEEATVDQEDEHVCGEERADRGRRCPDETELGYMPLSGTGKATVSGLALWRQQVSAIAWMNFLQLKSSVKNPCSILLLCVVLLLPLILQMFRTFAWQSVNAWELSSTRYFLPREKRTQFETTTLLVLNNTGKSIEDFIHLLESQDLTVEIANEEKIMKDLNHNGAINPKAFILFPCSLKSYRFAVSCHVEISNCYPVLVNIISNSLLRALNSTAHIRVWNYPFSSVRHELFWIYFIFFYFTYMLMLFPGFPPFFAMSYMHDYRVGARTQLRVSGLFPSAYWCGQALVDIPLCWFLLFSMFGLQRAISNNVFGTAKAHFFLIMGTLGYGISIVLLMYVISFIFRKGQSCERWSFILIVVSIWLNNVGVFYFGDTLTSFYVTSLLIPTFPLMGVVLDIQEVSGDAGQVCSCGYLFFFFSFFQPYIHSVAFIFLLRLLEVKCGKPVLRRDPIFRISPRRETGHQHVQEIEEEDEDVKAERAAVRNAIVATSQEEKSVIIVSNLCKAYEIKQASSILKKKKKMVTKNVSFCVKKGEVLGLLGPIGAGKSTTIKMITGETTLTAGQVLMKSEDEAASHLQDQMPSFLGYCPQEDLLWPDLTVRDHLWVYATVKGVHKEDRAAAVNRIVTALQLQDCLHKKTIKLSAGMTRKLSFAICMLGNPTILLLDEPSTGMDPNGQHCAWKMIRAALKTKETGAILLTHSMEEAEAVCDRVAIMVSGQLRCIGSIQYLKNKFGKGYLLEIKVRDSECSDLLHAEILKIFPSAARQERLPSLLIYKIPMEDALPLSQSFAKLEEASSASQRNNQSLSHPFQVFLELSREQEKDNFDLTLDGGFKWKQLQKED